MTPEERAEKIYYYIQLQYDEDPTYDMMKISQSFITVHFREVMQEAYEDAAKIAFDVVHLPKLDPGEEWSQEAVDAIVIGRNQAVEAIRARAKEVSK